MTAFVFGLFGLIVGSFLNVVIVRRGARSLGGRSGCMQCGHTLEAADLVPVFSYLALRGRCRYCRARISIQYPLVEAATAVLFSIVGGAPLSLALQLLALPILALFVCIAVYDMRHTIIPDEWVYSLALLSFIFGTMYSADALTTLLTGVAAASPFALLWLLSRGRWMGLGDGKLALSIGFLLGPWGAYLALTAAFVLGALFFVPLLLLQQVDKRRRTAAASYTMKSEVPLGPFLIITCVTIWFLQVYGVSLVSMLFGA
jgi:leader peptidase (prepilin peptidase)/N-methyltransferase